MLHLLGLGHYHPDNILDNAFFESLDIGTTDEWIVSRVGIHSRRTVLPLDYIRTTKNHDIRAAEEAATMTNVQTGARAARVAMERAGVGPSDIGLVVGGGCSPNWSAPAEAAAIACELGIDSPAFDMHAACSTFGLHLHHLSQMTETLPDYVLCLQVENNTRIADYTDRGSCVLWGDGTAAAVVSARHAGRARVLRTTFGSAPAGAMDVVIPRAGFFRQDGAKVHKFAIKRMTALFQDYRNALPREQQASLVYVGHQANLTMLRAVEKRCDVPTDQHWFNIDQFGNQGSSGAPAVLSQRWEEIAPGTRVATVVVGAGLSWSVALIGF